jgi:hypothetical protein
MTAEKYRDEALLLHGIGVCAPASMRILVERRPIRLAP